MLCSNLNDHLYSHIHVVDNPMCPCGHVRENNRHFLLECALFNVERNCMLAKLRVIAFVPHLKTLLYGNLHYTEECNRQAFDIVQEFIQTTGRFDWVLHRNLVTFVKLNGIIVLNVTVVIIHILSSSISAIVLINKLGSNFEEWCASHGGMWWGDGQQHNPHSSMKRL